MRRLAVIGSRDFPRFDMARWHVSRLPDDTIIVSGGARGVDQVAVEAAVDRGLDVEVYLPDYGRYGRGAPLVRNDEIVEACDEVLAFWDGESRGTKYTIDRAVRAGKPVEVWGQNGPTELL